MCLFGFVSVVFVMYLSSLVGAEVFHTICDDAKGGACVLKSPLGIGGMQGEQPNGSTAQGENVSCLRCCRLYFCRAEIRVPLMPRSARPGFYLTKLQRLTYTNVISRGAPESIVDRPVATPAAGVPLGRDDRAISR